MKAAQISKAGGDFELIERATPEPGPGQVRVKVEACGVSMNFAYKDYFKMAPNTGYETLIYDCMTGDATLFQRADNIEAGWAAVQPILDAWANNRPRDFPNYAAGSDGPVAADELLARRTCLAVLGRNQP